MILQGSQRGGAKELAMHLLKDENEHVEVHELRGFVSDDLVSALNEAYAVSRGTKARQFLFSLSLNPPAGENVVTEDFEKAIEQIETKLGLTGQPRAIVFHEKKGRRHAHAVWSRINVNEMKAIQLSHTKHKLKNLSRELYLQHGWKMPRGFANSTERDPRNFTLAQWQQAKRSGHDPRDIKAAIQESWAISDTQEAFQQALKERGFTLAKGDRRSFVALDHRCEIFAIPKWLGKRVKEVRARLTDQAALPTVAEAKEIIAKDMTDHLRELNHQSGTAIDSRLAEIEQKRSDMEKLHGSERQRLQDDQHARWIGETKQRQARYNKGLQGFWDRLTGRHQRIKNLNERETVLAYERDRLEKDKLIFCQLELRRTLQSRIERLNMLKQKRTAAFDHDIKQYREISKKRRETYDFSHHNSQDNNLERER